MDKLFSHKQMINFKEFLVLERESKRICSMMMEFIALGIEMLACLWKMEDPQERILMEIIHS